MVPYDGEWLKPGFDALCSGVAEAVRERVCSALLFSKDAADTVSITLFLASVVEAVSVECCLQPRCGVDEKEFVINEMFVGVFSEEHLSNRLISRQA
jgi:hypothetical protein